MSKRKQHTGFAIAIAWPELYCKQAGSWYEFITIWLGINKNNYYKAGHAALVLVDIETQKCHYFDFGRYHAPFSHGRVRNAETDTDLEIKTIPLISKDSERLENFEEILLELQQNPACHGEGTLYASNCKINFQSAYQKALHLQEMSPIPYGPFRYKGSNCSRFVNSSLLAGKPGWNIAFRLKYLVPLTPTPLNNVHSLGKRFTLPKILKKEAFIPLKKLDKNILLSTLPQPERHQKIPENAQWLSGEGAGSWFAFEEKDNLLLVNRFAPDGTLECSGIFGKIENLDLLNQDFIITYPSNCKQVTIKLKNEKIIFHRQ